MIGPRLDPVTTEVINNSFVSTADENPCGADQVGVLD